MIKFIGYRNKIRWYAQTYHFDTDTGEIISEQEAKQNYYIVEKRKKIIINNETSRTITRTNRWRRRPQQTQLW